MKPDIEALATDLIDNLDHPGDVSIADHPTSPRLGQPMKTTIIVPAFNEQDGLPVVLRKILPLMDDDWELLIIDDGSTDRTREVAMGFPCRVITHDVNQGKGRAIRTGIAHARGEHIIWIDADDTYPAYKIPEIDACLSAGADLVYTARLNGREHIPPLNRLGNIFFYRMTRLIYGFKPCDPLSGLCGVKKSKLDTMRLEAKRFSIECEIAAKAGRMRLHMVEMPIEYGRRIGTTKLNSLRDGLDIFLTLLRFSLWSPESLPTKVER